MTEPVPAVETQRSPPRPAHGVRRPRRTFAFGWLEGRPRARGLPRPQRLYESRERLRKAQGWPGSPTSAGNRCSCAPAEQLGRGSSLASATAAAPPARCRLPAPGWKSVQTGASAGGDRREGKRRLRARPTCRTSGTTGQRGAPCTGGLAEARWAAALVGRPSNRRATAAALGYPGRFASEVGCQEMRRPRGKTARWAAC